MNLANVSKVEYYTIILKEFGFWGLITYNIVPKKILAILSKAGLNFQKKYIPLLITNIKYPFWMRYASSDVKVFDQIFLDEEYAFLGDLGSPKLILDCGANVGYSSIYFLNKYPNARVIAVEPDPENFKVCQKNLSPYGERVSLVMSGIWSHKVGLAVCKAKDGGEWGTEVKECLEDQKPDLQAIDISSLLEKSGFNSIDLLKMDVEGSEAVIFSQNYEKWLGKVKNIVIELHGEKCRETFLEALSAYNYDYSEFGELTACKKISPKTMASVGEI